MEREQERGCEDFGLVTPANTRIHTHTHIPTHTLTHSLTRVRGFWMSASRVKRVRQASSECVKGQVKRQGSSQASSECVKRRKQLPRPSDSQTGRHTEDSVDTQKTARQSTEKQRERVRQCPNKGLGAMCRG